MTLRNVRYMISMERMPSRKEWAAAAAAPMIHLISSNPSLVVVIRSVVSFLTNILV